MNTDTKRSIFVSTLASLLTLFCLDLLAQSPDSPAPADDAGSVDEVTTLDLFDEDTELTKTGWAQFYVSAGLMYLDGDGRYSARLPDGSEIPIINFDRAGLKESDSSYWLSINWRSAHSWLLEIRRNRFA
jgi:hypothetical protein